MVGQLRYRQTKPRVYESARDDCLRIIGDNSEVESHEIVAEKVQVTRYSGRSKKDDQATSK